MPKRTEDAPKGEKKEAPAKGVVKKGAFQVKVEKDLMKLGIEDVADIAEKEISVEGEKVKAVLIQFDDDEATNKGVMLDFLYNYFSKGEKVENQYYIEILPPAEEDAEGTSVLILQEVKES